jgi:hypothetical protein
MRLYVRLMFSSEGQNPVDVVRKLEAIGFAMEVGNYDVSAGFQEPQKYAELVTDLRKALKGTDVLYSLTTKER